MERAAELHSRRGREHSRSSPTCTLQREAGRGLWSSSRKRAENSRSRAHLLPPPRGGHPVLARSLGPVQLIVCLLDELLQAGHVLGKSGDAQRDRYGTTQKGFILGCALVFDSVAYSFGDLDGVFYIAAHQNNKLFAPVAGHHVVCPRRLTQHASYTTRGLVPAPVPVAVVVRLEVVHIKHGAGEGQTVSLVDLYPPLRRPVEEGSADQAGQVIHVGRPPQGGDFLTLRPAYQVQGQTYKTYGDQFGDVCGGVL